jgi:nucleoid-associated protein YgaU
MALQTAYIDVLGPDLKTAARKVKAQFNPAELSFSKTATMAEIAIPGLDAPVLQFIRGGTETLTLELLFDSTEKGMGDGAESVSKQVDEFYSLVKQDPKEHAPPVCRFSWGEPSNLAGQKGNDVSHAPFWFTCVVESVDRKFTMFNPQGLPLRARVTVKLREYQTVEQMVSKLESADHTKSRSFKRRERLDQIAAQEYGSSAEWRRIADENGILDPRGIEAGTLLRLPPMRVGSVIGGSD